MADYLASIFGTEKDKYVRMFVVIRLMLVSCFTVAHNMVENAVNIIVNTHVSRYVCIDVYKVVFRFV